MTDTPAPAADPTPSPAPAPAPAASPAPPAPSPAPAPAPSADPKPPAPSLAAADPADDDRIPAAGFPDDWREQMAGEDPKMLGLLKRYRSPSALGKALLDARTKLSQGAQIKDKPGEDATDEEKAAWRERQGVPKGAAEYEKGLKLSDGLVLSDQDKVLFKGFAEHVHKFDWPQEQVNQAMAWYFDHVSSQQAAMADADTDHQAEGIKALKEEMGPADFKRNLKAIDALRRPEIEGEEGFLNGILNTYRGPDGRLLGNDPRMVRFLVNAALEIDPQARVAPTDPNMGGKGLDARIAEIEAIQRDPVKHAEYDRNPAMQAEYGRLLEAREKIASRRTA